MTADELWLEEQLAELRPVRPSRRVEGAVARRLAPASAWPRRLALAALAASVLLLSLVWSPGPRPRPPGASTAAAPSPVPPAAPPSLALYSRALSDSPEALERLLDRPTAGRAAGAPAVALSSALPD